MAVLSIIYFAYFFLLLPYYLYFLFPDFFSPAIQRAFRAGQLAIASSRKILSQDGQGNVKVEGESVKDGANSSSLSRESRNLERWNVITPKRKKKEISNDAIITEPVVYRKKDEKET